MTEAPEGLYVERPGTFTSIKPQAVRLAEVRAGRCFSTDNYAVEDRDLHAVTEQQERDGISLRLYLGWDDDAARRVGAASGAARDAAIIAYFKSRMSSGAIIHRFFGDPGLQAAAARYAGPERQAAIAILRERLTSPGFGSALSPLERAEIVLLAQAPHDFVSCIARRRTKSKA
jgi:hypothetical protein